MMKSIYAERKSFERESFQRSRTFNRIEKNLDKLRRAAKTNNSNLWKAAENSFLDLISLAEYEGLSPQKKGRYIREYHNIIPPEEIMIILENSERSKERERAESSFLKRKTLEKEDARYRHGDNTTLRGICSSEVRKYRIGVRSSES